MATDSDKVREVRTMLSPGGEYEPCQDNEDCGHGECDVARAVLGVVE